MNKRSIWIRQGYKSFAHEGPAGLKVERMARSVDKSKSSFYHHFADLEVFTEELLHHHIEQGKAMAAKESAARNQEDLIEIILEHKPDLLFNRQLRIHRENKDFEQCFTKVNQMSIPAILPVWKQIIGLDDNSYLAQMVFQLSLDNFSLQITDETLNRDWLNAYFENIVGLITQLKNTKKVEQLDGSV